MTQEEREALRKSMEHFGYLTPIITDQKYLLADGENRLEIYKEFGKKTIPTIVLKLKTDADRRILRQVMNKLRGTHDVKEDAAEFQKLLKDNRLEDLAALLARPVDEFTAILARQGEGFEPEEAGEIEGSLATKNKCPKCGFEF